MRREEAQKIATETRKTYDAAAGEFSASRAKFWGELTFLADQIKTGDHVLDIGCGNGRFFTLVKERGAAYTGIDYSVGLIGEAKRLHPDGRFLVGDATELPLPTTQEYTFDIAYSFAVIHHIPSDDLRVKFVREAARVLRPGGMLILTTWDLWSPRHFGTLLINILKNILWWHTPLNIKDVVLTLGKNRAPRYLHAFTKRELATLLTKNDFSVENVSVIARPSGEKNIVVVAKKKAASHKVSH